MGTAPMDNFDINKGVKGLYFSAHWCGPCRNFTPNLVKAYKEVKATNPDFEIVFVTSDRTEEGFKSYFGEMPWAALSWDQSAERESIEEKFGVQGIPALVMMQDGKLLNGSAVGNVRTAGGPDEFNASAAAAKFPWKEEAVQELGPSTAGNLNECACLILFQDKGVAEDVQKSNAAFLETAAKAELESALSGNERKMGYYTHNAVNDVTPTLKKMMTELETENKMVILHFGGQGAYYLADLPKSEDDVTKFVADFHAGNLKRLQANPPR